MDSAIRHGINFGMEWFFSKLINYMFPSFFKVRSKVIRWHILWGFFLLPLIFLVIGCAWLVVYSSISGAAYLLVEDNSFVDRGVWVALIYILTGVLSYILFWSVVGFIIRRPMLFKAMLLVAVPIYTIGMVWSFFSDPNPDFNSEPIIFRGFILVMMSISPACLGYWLYAMVSHADKDFDVALINYDLGVKLHKSKKYFLAFSYIEDLAFKKKHRLSLNFLGNVYENGLGKEVNRGHAYACYDAAASLGHDVSVTRVEALKTNLTTQEIKDCEKFRQKYLNS